MRKMSVCFFILSVVFWFLAKNPALVGPTVVEMAKIMFVLFIVLFMVTAVASFIKS